MIEDFQNIPGQEFRDEIIMRAEGIGGRRECSRPTSPTEDVLYYSNLSQGRYYQALVAPLQTVARLVIVRL